ncbi:hypothetical protein ABZ368_09360 [Streptomyces sp. NPDC005908]|uniref:hypothetical protein n=1 Tax=unclassified Streptomyces TaxID=2593676 RepID=UPI0011ADC55B|nr:hypothetical protein [Streptomyces sp. T12]TWD22865.1 hypothetical protein FB570_105265 [Streptomyces sp. T12]
MNRDAFWDAITGLVKIPDHVRFIGWDRLTATAPRGATTLCGHWTTTGPRTDPTS